mgnify:CR=1 FL=1
MPRLAALLAFAWVAWPFSQYASSSNTNDTIQPALLVWGFYAVSSPALRGGLAALSAWTKLGALIVLPLWSGYPEARRLRPRLAFLAGAAVATAAAFSVLLLEPSPIDAAVRFLHRTFGYQVGRQSPFSIWGWGQYHARGLPDLAVVQKALTGLLLVGAAALAWWPRRRSALQLAAFTTVLLAGLELVLTHWYYPYLVWFYPFAVITLLAI